MLVGHSVLNVEYGRELDNRTWETIRTGEGLDRVGLTTSRQRTQSKWRKESSCLGKEDEGSEEIARSQGKILTGMRVDKDDTKRLCTRAAMQDRAASQCCPV